MNMTQLQEYNEVFCDPNEDADLCKISTMCKCYQNFDKLQEHHEIVDFYIKNIIPVSLL